MVWGAVAALAAPFVGQLASKLFGGGDDKSSQPQQLPTMSPEQQQLLSQLIGNAQGAGAAGGGAQNAMGLLQQYLNPQSDVYRNFEAPYMQQFQQQTIPQLSEQFGGFGANSGALSSSGFGQALGAAGANLQTNLAQMKSGMQRNAINDLLSNYLAMTGQALGKDPFAYHQQDKGGGMGAGFAQGFSQGLPGFMQGIGDLFSGNSGGNYQSTQPLTNTYADLFKTGAADFYGM
jgi:hypothetical protein